jgi:hypothetical protein
MNGSFGSLLAYTNLLGTSVSELLAMIMLSGEQLNEDTDILSKASNDLSEASSTYPPAQAMLVTMSKGIIEKISDLWLFIGNSMQNMISFRS